jgi:hypothetical protein
MPAHHAAILESQSFVVQIPCGDPTELGDVISLGGFQERTASEADGPATTLMACLKH